MVTRGKGPKMRGTGEMQFGGMGNIGNQDFDMG